MGLSTVELEWIVPFPLRGSNLRNGKSTLQSDIVRLTVDGGSFSANDSTPDHKK